MKQLISIILLLTAFIPAQAIIINAYCRESQSLNGHWDVIVDQYDQGRRLKVYENKTAESPEEFYEYKFSDAVRLSVPGDWNSQMPELKLYEGTVWYGRHFNSKKEADKRNILYFAGVNYRSTVYLNGKEIASHEGGFTPFEIDVTDYINEGDNFLVVETNNTRKEDAIPAMSFDWWNYGGITRDVMLISVPDNYIEDYFVRLRKGSPEIIDVDLKMSEPKPDVKVSISIPELGKNIEAKTDSEGRIKTSIKVKNLKRWEPGKPYLYDVELTGDKDKVSERIGFRNIDVDGTKILINGHPVFMRSVSFHEEIPQRMGRAYSVGDALLLLAEANELGVNMVRTAHYPQNEHIVREAEEMGILLWEEIPVWQGIDFSNAETRRKASDMFMEMLARDKNRCAVGFWSVANETKPSPERNDFLQQILTEGKKIDDTRLYTAAFDLVYFDEDKGIFTMNDPFTENLDVVGINKYMGWYHPWPVKPNDAKWDVVPNKPLIITEFGGEALYGQKGDRDFASSWGEDYQARLYEDNLVMMNNIPNLAGVSPWVLFDFRSPFRFHPTNQEGWNRKGLVSDRGQRKKAWYLMKKYYDSKKHEK